MKKVIIKLIKIYQIMPFKSHQMCRFTPTCSEYMILCLQKYSLFKGLKLGFKRLAKCHPFGPFGYDPVPSEER
ncbi:MAG TPA: membrane protein insertion efficiency factor YidD [Bacilli bacterium]|nr:membrane protein insertion efficiency factor YidD [Bacilli bacterium]